MRSRIRLVRSVALPFFNAMVVRVSSFRLGTISMLVAIAKDDAVEETLAWIDQMIQDDSIDAWSRQYSARTGISKYSMF